MSTPSSVVIDAVVIATILAAVLLLFVVTVIRRARDRRRQLSEDLAADRTVIQDRAYNSIRLATAEATVLERDGVDTSAPRRLLEQADVAMKRGDHYHALSLGRAAHEGLVKLRHQDSETPLASAASTGSGAGRPTHGTADLLLTSPDRGAAALLPETDAVAASRSAVPKNRVEAHFQIRLLTEELALAESRRPGQTEVVEAARLLSDAQAAEGKGEYTDALRSALKGRRRVGGRVESLPPTPPRAAVLPTGSASERPSVTRLPVTSAPAGTESCPKCGKPTRASDLFCRSCGAPVGTAKCQRCQAALEPEDQFCPRCGAPTG